MGNHIRKIVESIPFIPMELFYSNDGSWSLSRVPGSYCQPHRAAAEMTECDELDKSLKK